MKKLTLICFALLCLNSTFVLADDSSTNSSGSSVSDANHPAEFNGMCAMAVADGHMKEPGDAKYQASLNGKTYYFCSDEAKQKFLSKKSNEALAHRRWEQGVGELKGSHGS